MSTNTNAKMIKEYVGKLNCTTYHVSDNTPRGSRETSSGAVATEYHTVAVDKHNPRFPIGTRLYVKGFGEGVVEDVGDFGRYGVSLDLFTPENDGYRKDCDVYIYRPETKQEIEQRMAKVRSKRQKKKFTIIYDDTLQEGEAITDSSYIKNGTILIGNTFLDVKEHRKGLKNTIRIGNKIPYFTKLKVKLAKVWEGAVG